MALLIDKEKPNITSIDTHHHKAPILCVGNQLTNEGTFVRPEQDQVAFLVILPGPRELALPHVSSGVFEVGKCIVGFKTYSV